MKALLALLLSATPILWRDPGPVSSVDFLRPARNANDPAVPFRFSGEDLEGTSAKIVIQDAKGGVWRVKSGPEARAETFITRFLSALGYFGEPTVFLASGRIEGLKHPLARASHFVRPDGAFTWASFEYRDPRMKFLPELRWRWDDNPFVGTHELNGLKILVMLFSNWDNKDGRDTRRGPNTGVLDTQGGLVYFVTDWGQSLGAWGSLAGRSHWNCTDYARQTPAFVRRIDGNRVIFGYQGQHSDFWRDVRVGDVHWLMKYLGGITNAQIRTGLLASGATADEQDCFAREIRRRIERLREVSARYHE